MWIIYQRRATNFILKTEDTYACRLNKLNLLSLEKRRLLADVTFLYKALNGIIDINVEPYVDFYKETDHYSFRHNDNEVNSEDEICKNERP